MPTFTLGFSRALLLAVIVAAVPACSAAISPISVEAARTAARVKTALVNDPTIGTRVIDVRVVAGVVQLAGRVGSQEEADLAVTIARSVTGVTQVDSRLQIGADPAIEPPVEVAGSQPARGVALEFAELEESRGGIALGAALGLTNQGRREDGTRVSISPLVRLGSGAGLGPALAFDWFDATLLQSFDARSDSGRVRLRPIMAGVHYTLPMGRLSFAPSLVGGYAFNSIRVPEQGDVNRLPVGVDNSFVWRPGLSVWIESGRRTVINLSVGRVMTSPRVTFVEGGQLREQTLSADTTILVVGLAYKLF